MASYSDYTWAVLNQVKTKMSGVSAFKIDFFTYVDRSLRSEGIDPEITVSADQSKEALDQVVYWMRRMIQSKRSQAARRPDKNLDGFCNELEQILNKIEPPAPT